jgi:hypothetical protein
VYAAEVVVREVQRDSRFQVEQLLAESVRQARESADCHSHRQVLPLYVRRRDVLRIRIASSDFGYNLHDAWWGVPRIGAIVLSVIPEQFHKLREVNV